jgi:hypothetical protein
MATPTVAILGLVLLTGALAGPFQNRQQNAQFYDEVRQLLSLNPAYQVRRFAPRTRTRKPESALAFATSLPTYATQNAQLSCGLPARTLHVFKCDFARFFGHSRTFLSLQLTRF